MSIQTRPWPPFRRQGTTITQRTAGDTLALGAGNLTMTGSLGATGAGKLLKGWFIDVEITSLPTINGGTLATALSLGTAAYTASTAYAAALSGTQNEIAYFNTTTTIASLTVATYPSLTELSYVKGVTSGIQAQINAKGVGTVTAVSVATANGVSGSSSGGATPALTITLGAITPSSVASTGAITTGANGGTIGSVKLFGNTSGDVTLTPNAIAGTGIVLTLPATTGTVALGTGTANEIAYWSATNTLGTLAVATYPSLTELSYVKGVTSAIQTQIGNKAPSTAPTFATSITGSYLTASEILITDVSKNIVSAPVATYPSLTELSYVKGLSSAVQTQLGNKAPSANPTFTGTVILPKTIEIQDTSADHQYVLAVSELTADRTITLPLLTGTDTFVFQAHTQTLTNKRITQRVTTTTDDATAVIDIDACDVYELSAVANATEFTTTGTPTDGQKLIIRLKDAGVAKGLTWTGFTAIGITLPTTTVAGKWHYIGATYNSAATAWHAIAYSVQA